ncbi:class II fructose-bisphosphate aldolase [Campylobacter jejuni]|nr:class II fructose-bisphosphate aldolase [Campylobacter jejuni]
MGVLDIVKAGVISGDELNKVYDYAKAEGFAIPAVNVVGTDSINAVLEAAKKLTLQLLSSFQMAGQNFMQGKFVLMEKF